MRTALVFVTLLILPGPIRAQAGPEPTEARVSPTGALVLKASRIAEGFRPLFGLWAGLRFSDRIAVGGGGFALLNETEIEGSDGVTGNTLSLGYGGVVFRYWEPLTRSITGQAGLLLGAGHAEVKSQLTGAEVGSDNFLVAEGELGAAYSLADDMHLSVSLGYRLTAGVEDLPRVSGSELRGFSGTISIRIGG